MDVKQEYFDFNTETIKMELDLVSEQTDGNYWCSTKGKTFKNDQDCVLNDTDNICEYQTTRKLVKFDEIKQESELLKIEGSDFVENTEYESVCDNINNFPTSIKKEPENADEVNAANIGDIKPAVSEISEYVQFKNESELLLLTSHCDLPTLKYEIEHADLSNYFAQPCSSKRTLLKSKTKHSARNVSMQNKRGYPWSALQKIFRSSGRNLFNAQFGRFGEICLYCGQFFLTKSHFIFHFILIHCVKRVTKSCKRKFEPHKRCRCKNCLRTVFKHPPTANIVFHSNEKQLLQCEICSKTFSTKRNLNIHLRLHDGKNKCEICLKQFSYTNNLKIHLFKIHSDEKPFACEMCSKRFKHKSDFKRHLIIHTGKKPFACDICSKWFAWKGYLKEHLMIHSGEKPLVCEICSKRFSRKCDLKRHLTIHSEEKPFACEMCSKRFKQKSDLNKHLKIHTGQKPFACEICSKRFKQKSHLNRHLIIHAGKKPFKCEICSRLFPRISDLKNHLIIHNGENFIEKSDLKTHLIIQSEDKPFSCEICSKRFKHKNDLKKHSITHSGKKPFACEICSKRFAQKSNLKGHSIIHKGEKPFACEICSKRYGRKSELKRHLIIHTEKKCEICSRLFPRISDLKKHLIIHNREKTVYV